MIKAPSQRQCVQPDLDGDGGNRGVAERSGIATADTGSPAIMSPASQLRRYRGSQATTGAMRPGVGVTFGTVSACRSIVPVDRDSLRVQVSQPASKAFDSHQLCSKKVDYPKTRSHGNNTAHPDWTGAFGGRNAAWMTPIVITCMGLDWGPVCTKDTSPAVTLPNLWKAVDGSDAYRSQEWYDGVDQLSQLPAHPNFWGQRALASCNAQVSTDPGAVGKVVTCTPSSNRGLDAYGRPFMTTRVGDAL